MRACMEERTNPRGVIPAVQRVLPIPTDGTDSTVRPLAYVRNISPPCSPRLPTHFSAPVMYRIVCVHVFSTPRNPTGGGGGMATLRLFRTTCACLTMCPFVMCGGDGRVFTRVSMLLPASRTRLLKVVCMSPNSVTFRGLLDTYCVCVTATTTVS